MADSELLQRYVREDSEDAFAALVARHVNLVYSAALRKTGNPHVAEEITQVVFTILAKKAAGLRKQTILSGWLYQTARLTAASFLRTEIRRARREQEAYVQSLSNDTEAETWRQIAPMLEDAMGQLDEKDRNAIILRFFEGKTMQEVGTAFGASENAAKKRVNRALNKLRKVFTKRGVASTTAIIAGAISTNSVHAAPAVLAKSVTAVAIAKGATASGSTLILIKGALKLMAWTKAKSAAVATAAVILAIVTTTFVVKTIQASRVAAYPNIQGAWEGVMQLDDAGVGPGEAASTRVVLKLTKTNDGYCASMDWIEKGRRDVPMGRVVYDYPSLRIERNVRETWNLTVNADATEMILDHSLHFIQPDPVVLKRTATPDLVPERLAAGDFTPRAGSDLQGYWKGTIGTGPDALPVSLKITEQPDGTFRAEGDNPMQGANGQPVLVTYSRPTVTLALASGAGMFEGKISSANTEIVGRGIQGGQSMPMAFQRADFRAEHAQDASKDYSFTSKNDLPGHWKGSWILPFGNVKVKIRFALDIAKLPDGTYSAALANLDQFGNDDPIPPSDFEYSLPRLRLEWKWAGGAFEGRLQNGKLTGIWQQGGGGFPLVFERSQ